MKPEEACAEGISSQELHHSLAINQFLKSLKIFIGEDSKSIEEFSKKIKELVVPLATSIVFASIQVFPRTRLPEHKGPGQDLVRFVTKIRKNLVAQQDQEVEAISLTDIEALPQIEDFSEDSLPITIRNESDIRCIQTFLDVVYKVVHDKFRKAINFCKGEDLNEVLAGNPTKLSQLDDTEIILTERHRRFDIPSPAQFVGCVFMTVLMRDYAAQKQDMRDIRHTWFRCFPKLRSLALTPSEQEELRIKQQEADEKRRAEARAQAEQQAALRAEKMRENATKRALDLFGSLHSEQVAAQTVAQIRKKLKADLAIAHSLRSKSSIPIEPEDQLRLARLSLKEFVNSQLHSPPSPDKLETLQLLFIEADDEVREADDIVAELSQLHSGSPLLPLQDLILYVEAVMSAKIGNLLKDGKSKRYTGLIDALISCEAAQILPLLDGNVSEHKELASRLFGNSNISTVRDFMLQFFLGKISTKPNDRVPGIVSRALTHPSSVEILGALDALPTGIVLMGACCDWDRLRETCSALRKVNDAFYVLPQGKLVPDNFGDLLSNFAKLRSDLVSLFRSKA